MEVSEQRTGFSLRWQIALLTAVIVAVSLASLGLIAFSVTRDTVIELTLDKLAAETRDAADGIQRVFAVTRADAVNVPRFPPIPGIVRTLETGQADADGSTTEIWIARLRQILQAQMSTYPERMYCALVDADGNELMRVERLSGDRFRLAPAAALRNVAGSEHFAEAKNLRAAEAFVSAPSLDDAGEPAIYVVTPYVHSGNVKAVFVIKLDGNAVLQLADEIITIGSTAIVDEQGMFLYSDDPEIRRFDNAYNYAQRYPVRAERMKDIGADADEFSEFIGANQRPGPAVVGIYKKIHYNPEDRTRYLAIAPSIRAEAALEPVYRLQRLFLSVGLGVLVIGVAVSFFASTRLTSALRELTAAADEIAAGREAQLPTENQFGEVSALRTSLDTMTRTLRDSASRVRAVLDATADAIITINESGTVRSFNASAEKLFGYRSSEVIGKNVSMLAPPPHRAQHDQYLERYLRTGEAHIINAERELEGERSDGSTFPMLLRVTELSYADGARVFIGTVQDITARKQAEEERAKLFDGIREAVNRLATSTHQILATTSNQTTDTQQQAAVVGESAATVEQLARTAEQAAQSADAVAAAARQSEQVSTEGSAAVQQTIDAMRGVKEQVGAIAESILGLAERAQTIGEITSTVRDIAEQTNVLALNAAVEASRAGDQGKGFAVVAAEVKLLAEDSKRATEQVRKLLEEIQQATNHAVLSTEQGSRAVSDAEAVVHQAGETIGALSRTVAESARSAQQISSAANEQATGVSQLNQGMKRIEQATKKHAAATQEIELAVQNLTSLSNELASLTARGNA